MATRAKLQNTGPLLTIHQLQTSRLLWLGLRSFTFFLHYRAELVLLFTTEPNEPLNIWTQDLTSYKLFLVLSPLPSQTRSFIHYRAKRASKYMNPRLNVVQIIPRSFIHCLAKQAATRSCLDSGPAFCSWRVHTLHGKSRQSFSNSIGHRSTEASSIWRKERLGRVNWNEEFLTILTNIFKENRSNAIQE